MLILSELERYAGMLLDGSLSAALGCAEVIARSLRCSHTKTEGLMGSHSEKGGVGVGGAAVVL